MVVYSSHHRIRWILVPILCKLSGYSTSTRLVLWRWMIHNTRVHSSGVGELRLLSQLLLLFNLSLFRLNILLQNLLKLVVDIVCASKVLWFQIFALFLYSGDHVDGWLIHQIVDVIDLRWLRFFFCIGISTNFVEDVNGISMVCLHILKFIHICFSVYIYVSRELFDIYLSHASRRWVVLTCWFKVMNLLLFLTRNKGLGLLIALNSCEPVESRLHIVINQKNYACNIFISVLSQ